MCCVSENQTTENGWAGSGVGSGVGVGSIGSAGSGVGVGTISNSITGMVGVGVVTAVVVDVCSKGTARIARVTGTPTNAALANMIAANMIGRFMLRYSPLLYRNTFIYHYIL